jgi:hypothetical protein
VDAIERRLKLTINRLSHKALLNGFSFSAAKTQCVHFLRLRGVHPPPVFCLNNHALPVVPSAKFLGLVLVSKLSWEPHLRQLRASCERSLNVLCVLSGGSWGEDRTVMLRLYCSLVRSKLDYGSFIYRSATYAKLHILDPVHHAVIRLETAACRTRPAVSLYAESGEPSLSVRRNVLLCSYASKLAALIHHPSHSAFFRPAFRNHYERNTTSSWPAGLRFQQLLSDLHVTLPTVAPHEQMPVPPWFLFKATFNLRLTKYGKSTIPAKLFRRHFAEVTSKYPDHTHIFTNGSVIQGSTGCSFVFDSRLFIFQLRPLCSIYTAEL